MNRNDKQGPLSRQLLLLLNLKTDSQFEGLLFLGVVVAHKYNTFLGGTVTLHQY